MGVGTYFSMKVRTVNENNYKSRVLYCQHTLMLGLVKNFKPCCFEYSVNEYRSLFFNVFNRGRGNILFEGKRKCI